MNFTVEKDPQPAKNPARLFNIIWVSAYLLFTALLLSIRGALPGILILRWIWNLSAPNLRITIQNADHESGLCWVARLPSGILCDRDSVSMLELYEDGTKIGQAHCLHDEIRQHGKGRYSHWGDRLFFSTPDGTDPNTNGRTYELVERRW